MSYSQFFKTMILTAALTLCIQHSTDAANVQTVSLTQALEKGWVNFSAKGLGGHTGQCINLEITNVYKKEIKIEIYAGLNLIPDDTAIQNMIVTQDRFLVIAPQAKRNVKIYAMCTEKNDRGPDNEVLFAMGEMADGNLMEIVQFVNKKKFQSTAAQHAIWCITDNESLSGIYDAANTALSKELRLLVAKLTGNIPPWYTAEYQIQPGNTNTFKPLKIVTDFRYTLDEDGIVTFAIYNESGDVIQSILENHQEKAGMHLLKIQFEAKDLPDGKYFVRVLNEGKLIEEKIFEL